MMALHPNTRGFTLIEMLMVILIIGILVALVAGVSAAIMRMGDIEHTKTDMQSIVAGVEVFREETGSYPDGPSDQLAAQLAAVPAAQKRIASLDKQTLPNTNGGTSFRDRFGFDMLYVYDSAQRIGPGPGGAPLLKSAGPDGKFGIESENPGNLSQGQWDAQKARWKKDNIRSDGRKDS